MRMEEKGQGFLGISISSGALFPFLFPFSFSLFEGNYKGVCASHAYAIFLL